MCLLTAIVKDFKWLIRLNHPSLNEANVLELSGSQPSPYSSPLEAAVAPSQTSGVISIGNEVPRPKAKAPVDSHMPTQCENCISNRFIGWVGTLLV